MSDNTEELRKQIVKKLKKRFEFIEESLIDKFIFLYNNFINNILVKPIDYLEYIKIDNAQKRWETFNCSLCNDAIVDRRISAKYKTYTCHSCTANISSFKFLTEEEKKQKTDIIKENHRIREQFIKSLSEEELKEYQNKCYELMLLLRSGELLLRIPEDHILVTLTYRNAIISGERFTCQGLCCSIVERKIVKSNKSYFCKDCRVIIGSTKYNYEGLKKREEKENALRQKWRDENKEHVSEYNQKYQEENKQVIKEKAKVIRQTPEYKAKKKANHDRLMATDITYKMAFHYRTYIRSVLKRSKTKKSTNFENLVGCTANELRVYIESLWVPGMSWENHTPDGWHLDHIQPLMSYNLTDPEQQKEAFSYKNMQPLWWYDNLEKGDKILQPHTPATIREALDAYYLENGK